MEFLSSFYSAVSQLKTQVLMTVSDFSGFCSWNHFLEGGFTFQWRGGGCFSVGSGFHFYVRGCPMGAASILLGEDFRKSHRMIGEGHPICWNVPPFMGNP